MNIEDIKGIPLFKDISETVLKESFLPLLQMEEHRAGELIFEEGSTADAFFVIQKGEVEIRKIIDGETVRHKIIAILTEGDFFGEMAVFQMQPRSTEAVARSHVSLIRIIRDDLFHLFQRAPDIANQIMQFVISILMERIRATTKELATLYEVGRLVAMVHDVQELSGHVMGRILKDVETAKAGLFAVWNEFNEEFDILYQKGFASGEKDYFTKDDPLVMWLTDHKEPFLSFDLKDDRRLQISTDSIYYGASLLASPFISQDKLVGFLLIINRGMNRAFSYSQMVLLSSVSGYVAVAIENLKYRRENLDRSHLLQIKTRINM